MKWGNVTAAAALGVWLHGFAAAFAFRSDEVSIGVWCVFMGIACAILCISGFVVLYGSDLQEAYERRNEVIRELNAAPGMAQYENAVEERDRLRRELNKALAAKEPSGQ